jgi:hypothetical protein
MTWLAVLVTKFFERFYPMAHQRAYLSWLTVNEESREVWEPDELWQPEESGPGPMQPAPGPTHHRKGKQW